MRAVLKSQTVQEFMASATVDHSKLVPVNYKTYLNYFEPVSASKDKKSIDSRMRIDYNQMSIEYD